MIFVFLLLALALADYPIDFDTTLSRDVGGQYWLEPGAYSADVTDRNFGDHIVEFTFQPVHINHQCVYTIWLNDEKVMYGQFKNGYATIIPTLSGTFNKSASTADEQVITVYTEGCYLGRYAVPLNFGWNGDGLYIFDWSPAYQNEKTDSGYEYKGPNAYAPNGFEAYEAFAYYIWGSDGLAKISSQANDWTNDGGWWYPAPTSWTNSYDGYAFLVLDTTDIKHFNDTKDAFVVEVNLYGTLTTYAQVYLCNTTYAVGSSCEITEWNYDFNAFATAPTTELVLGYSSYPIPASAPTAFTRHYIPFDYNELDTGDIEVGTSLWVFEDDYFGGSGYGMILPQYVKLWRLPTDGDTYSDPIHVLVDLRDDVSDGDDCELYCINSDADPLGHFLIFGEPFFSGEPSKKRQPSADTGAISGTFIPNYYCGEYDTLDATWPVHCAQNAKALNLNYQDGAQTSACAIDDLNNIDLVKGDILTTGTTTVKGFNMEYSGFISAFPFDAGFPYVYGSESQCYQTESGYPPVWSQYSSYWILVDGEAVGQVQASLIQNMGLGRQIQYGAPHNFHIGDHTENITIQFKSDPSFSISYWPFLQINGFAAPLCTDDQCVNGACVDPYGSADCTIEGEPGLWRGTNGDEKVPYCTNTTCMNGGTCVENDARAWDPELYGTGGAIMEVWCNCSTAIALDENGDEDESLGYYWGDYCQYESPCQTNPCFNGGVCSQVADSDFTCDCSQTISPHTEESDSKPYDGDRCEIPTNDACDVSPCISGDCSVDESSSGGFKCDNCATGWSGQTCQIPPVDNCLLDDFANSCGSFGQCVPSNAGPNYVQCVCVYGYSGDDCTTPPDSCTDYCQNGGACVGVDGKVACLCSDPWVGQRCEWNATIFAGASSTSVSIFGALFLAVVALLF